MKGNKDMQSQIKKNKHGRSMIEMLGVLGIMAVITVLAIIAYKMAYRNSKMNELKQELGSINQQIETSYANQKFQDEGVVLGEDRTFENMFVDTNMIKSAITPFGGTYSISAVSNDLYEIKMEGIDEEDCNYIINDSNLLNKIEKMTISCVDINGLEHFAKNNTNDPDYSGGNGGNTGEPGGGDEPEEPFEPSADLREMFRGMDPYALAEACGATKNEAVCKALTDNAYYQSNVANACTQSKVDSVCEAYVESMTRESRMSSACRQGIDLACDKLLSLENPSQYQLASACEGGNEAVCQAFLDTGYQGGLAGACRGGNKTVCDAWLATNPSEDQLGSTCGYGVESVCEAYLAKNPTSEQGLADACKGGNAEICQKYLDSNPSSEYGMAYACQKGGNEAVCDGFLDKLEEMDQEWAYDYYLSDTCSNAGVGKGNKKVCDAYVEHAESKGDEYGISSAFANACLSTKDASLCSSALEVADDYGLKNMCAAGNKDACDKSCAKGTSYNASSCVNSKVMEEGGWEGEVF
ncbi:MAG: hypothetical protein N4A44_01180 [Alphaproteobacteria bacterium]|nr:hypothetical protein [Alphaproteobacteria bacterium]